MDDRYLCGNRCTNKSKVLSVGKELYIIGIFKSSRRRS